MLTMCLSLISSSGSWVSEKYYFIIDEEICFSLYSSKAFMILVCCEIILPYIVTVRQTLTAMITTASQVSVQF